jgi:hypothetical protein
MQGNLAAAEETSAAGRRLPGKEAFMSLSGITKALKRIFTLGASK